MFQNLSSETLALLPTSTLAEMFHKFHYLWRVCRDSGTKTARDAGYGALVIYVTAKLHDARDPGVFAAFQSNYRAIALGDVDKDAYAMAQWLVEEKLYPSALIETMVNYENHESNGKIHPGVL